MSEEITTSGAFRRSDVFTVQREDASAMVALFVRGVIDANTAPELAAAVDQVLAEVSSALIIDLTEVSFLASAGMTVLVKAKERSGERGFAVVADGPATSRPLSILGLDSELSLCASFDEARRRVSEPEN